MSSHSWRPSFAAVFVACLVFAAPALAGPASSGAAVGFARVNMADGAISALGGKGSKFVSSGPMVGEGIVTLFFAGRYPKNLGREQVVALASVEPVGEGCEFALANAVVSSAKNTPRIIELIRRSRVSLFTQDRYP